MNKAQKITIAITLLILALVWIVISENYFFIELIQQVIPIILIGGTITILFGLKKEKKD